MYRYYVTRNGVESEVTVEQYCFAEMEAGFSGPGHGMKPMQPATSSFSAQKYPGKPESSVISGRCRYIPDEVQS